MARTATALLQTGIIAPVPRATQYDWAGSDCHTIVESGGHFRATLANSL